MFVVVYIDIFVYLFVDKSLWKAVENVCISASSTLNEHGELMKAREEVGHQAAIEDVCERLQIAVEQFDQQQLTYLLAQANNLNIDHQKYPVVPVAQQYLDRIVEARQLIAQAMEQVEQSILEYAITYSETFGYETQEVQTCRQLRDTVLQLNTEAAYAVVMLEDEPMKNIIQRADSIHLTTSDIEILRNWIYHTSEEKLRQVNYINNKNIIACSNIQHTMKCHYCYYFIILLNY
jgi:hypothetical protein